MDGWDEWRRILYFGANITISVIDVLHVLNRPMNDWCVGKMFYKLEWEWLSFAERFFISGKTFAFSFPSLIYKLQNCIMPVYTRHLLLSYQYWVDASKYFLWENCFSKSLSFLNFATFEWAVMRPKPASAPQSPVPQSRRLTPSSLLNIQIIKF